MWNDNSPVILCISKSQPEFKGWPDVSEYINHDEGIL